MSEETDSGNESIDFKYGASQIKYSDRILLRYENILKWVLPVESKIRRTDS